MRVAAIYLSECNGTCPHLQWVKVTDSIRDGYCAITKKKIELFMGFPEWCPLKEVNHDK